MKTILSAFVGATLALAAINSSAQNERTSRPVALAIETDTLADALNQWAEETGFQLFSPSWDLAKKLNAPTLRGTFSAQVALERLLAGTPLTYEWLGDRGVTVRERTQHVSASTTQSTSAESPLSLGLLYLAEGPGPSAGASSPGTATARTSEPPKAAIQEIIVTGTHIRGQDSPPGSKTIVIDREAIDRSGHGTVQEVMRALPQNFSGGTTEINSQDTSALNLNAGTALNLRGLGPTSTLVLLNGRRQPAGGLNGAFVDISSIALSAIDHIDVLPDGASAIYGADAIGGVVNLVTRKDYSGAETSARFATLGGDADEAQISQLLGGDWASGNALFGYQYYKRESLARLDREYTASDDLRRFGGSDFRSFFSNPGNILNFNLQPISAIPRGQDGTSLTPADLLPGVTNFSNTSDQGDLLPEQELHSAFFMATQDIGDRISLFAESRFGRRETEMSASGATAPLVVPISNPYFVDVFGGAPIVLVGYNFLRDLGPEVRTSETTTYSGAAGVAIDVTEQWNMTVSGSYGEEKSRFESKNVVNPFALLAALADPNPSTAFNPFADGSNTPAATLDAIRAVQSNSADSTLWEANLLADGPLFDLPAGAIKLAVGADYREERLTSDSVYTGLPTLNNRIERNVSAVFGEMTIPVVGSSLEGQPPRVALSLAARNEEYSDFGSSSNPKVGFTVRPSDAIALRGTWGTSFRAPRLIDLLDATDANTSARSQAFIQNVPDPISPTGFSRALILTGGNPNLQPEEATTWTAGIDLFHVTPLEFDVSLTYFDIDYEDRILAGGGGNPFGILAQEAIWAPIITRNPTAAEVAAICSSARFTFGDCSIPPNEIIDVRLRNLAALEVKGFDLSISQRLDTEVGQFGLNFNGTYTLDYEQAVTATAPAFDLADTVGNPLQLRLRGSLSWIKGPIAITAFVNHAGGYIDKTNSPQRDVDAWTTADIQLAYRSDDAQSMLGRWSISLTATNVFDELPPFVNAGFRGYDTANATLLGRVISAQLTKTW